MDDAVKQIKRKLTFLETNKKVFLDFINYTGEYSDVEIKPFVYFNTTLGTGFVIEEIPVVDKYILATYFGEGEILQKIKPNTKNIADEDAYVKRFYNSEQEAELNIYSYLCNPPQISIYNNFVKMAHYPAPKLDEDDKPYLLVVPEINMPVPKLEKYSVEFDEEN
jgi:hypothetical protein